MKQLISLSIILIIFSGQTFAQGGNNKQNREDIRKKKYAFIVKELQLTEKEKNEFMPLYEELDRKKEHLHGEKRKLMKNFQQNSLNMNDDDLNTLIDKFTDIDIQLARLGKTYTDKFRKVISPMKIILLHHSEHHFKKMILTHAHKRKQPGTHK